MQRDALDEPLGDVHLVEHRQLHGDPRKLVEEAVRGGRVVLVLPVEIEELGTVEPVEGQDREDYEIQRDDGDVHVSYRGRGRGSAISGQAQPRRGESYQRNCHAIVLCRGAA
jgi:hypothetical protein